MNDYCRALAGRVPFAIPHSDHGLVIVRVNVEAIVASLRDGKSDVRSVNLPNFTTFKSANVDVQSALMQGNLDRIRSDIRKGKAALSVNAHHACTQAQFRARALVSPNVVRVS